MSSCRSAIRLWQCVFFHDVLYRINKRYVSRISVRSSYFTFPSLSRGRSVLENIFSRYSRGHIFSGFPRAGLEINILRQWTTGPPSLRIWWSGFKSGGPENDSEIRTIHFHLKFITERVQWSYPYLIITDSFGTDSSPSEQCQWITADDALRVRRQAQGLRNRTSRLSFRSNHGKVLSHFASYFLYRWLFPIVFRTACLPAIVPNHFLFPSGKSTPKLMTTCSHFHYDCDRWTGTEQHDPQMNDEMRDVSGDI